jgi:hypothetical protein
MRVVDRCQLRKVRKAQRKRTTQEQEHTGPRSKGQMPTGVGGARRFRRTATLPIASTKRRLKERQDRYKLPTAAQPMARRASTATTLRSAKRRMVTSMPSRTAIPTRTPGVAGRILVEAQANTAAQLTILPLRTAGESRPKAADHPPLAGAVGDGAPNRRALVVGRAGVGVVAGGATGEPMPRCGRLR